MIYFALSLSRFGAGTFLVLSGHLWVGSRSYWDVGMKGIFLPVSLVFVESCSWGCGEAGGESVAVKAQRP